MKTSRWAKLVSFVGTFAILFSMVTAAPAAAYSVIDLTNNTTHNAYWPDMSGNSLVYQNYDAADTAQVYLYNTATQVTTQLTNDANGAYSPSIDGNMVVYTRNNGANRSIVMMDITDPDSPVFTDLVNGLSGGTDDWGYYGVNRPDISGAYVCYRNNNNIYAINTALGAPYTPFQVNTSDGGHYKPSISGNYIVYHTWNTGGNGNEDVYMYDIATDTETAIADNSYDEYRPEVGGDKIVYEAYYDDGSGSTEDHTMMYDITAGTTTMISPAGEDSWWAKTDGEKITYTRNDTGGTDDWQIFLYDIASGTELRITDTTSDADADFPVYANSHVAWLNSNGDYDDIYVTALSAPPVFETLPGGTAPINIADGQVITTNPFIITVNPASEAGIVRVEFYVGGVLIGTDTTPGADGTFSFPWDTSLYQGQVTVRAYNSLGESTDIVRNTTVALQLPYTGI
jgi:beta propeller repeat protein